MSILSLIIKREFVAKVRNKSFIVMTFLSPLLMVGLAAFVGYLATMKADSKQIAIHDATGQMAKNFKNFDEYQFIDLSNLKLTTLQEQIVSDHLEGLLVIPKTDSISELKSSVDYLSNESPNLDFVAKIENIIADKITTNNYKKMGINPVLLQKATTKVNLNLKKASGETTLKGLNLIKIGIGGAFGYLIMMFIIIYGNMVMRSVIEEKTNRIIEIIISSVKPFTLMMGKIIGTSLAGILQFIIWASIGGLLFFVLSVYFGVHLGAASAIDSQAITGQNTAFLNNAQLYFNEFLTLPIATIIACFLLYFIGGYFLYSSIYAAIGAAVDSETDSQQFLMPIILPLMLGVYVGFFSVLNNPHGTIAIIFSMLPLTSPIVMMMRIPFGVPWWQIAISLLILFSTFLIIVWFASKIYRVGILMYGKKPSYKELYKWIKY